MANAVSDALYKFKFLQTDDYGIEVAPVPGGLLFRADESGSLAFVPVEGSARQHWLEDFCSKAWRSAVQEQQKENERHGE